MNPRKASVALLYNGKNATIQVAPYLASFRYTDVASGSSDSITLEINDRDRRWIGGWFPQKGDRLKPTVRMENWNIPGTLSAFSCGAFCVDDFSVKGNPIRMTLEGVAIPATSSFKATKRTITYESTTLKEIGKKVASRAGIALFYEAGNIGIEKIEQNNEDDCSFFNTIVTRYGLALKIYNDRLVVFSEGAYESKPVVATLSELDFDPNWTWNTKMAGTYTGVKYEYTNSEKNKTFTVTAGSGNRIFTCNESAENLTEATAIALAALNNANKSTTTLKITIKANPCIIATSCVQIVGLGKLSGKYFVEQADHSIGSGYKMALTLRKVEARFTSARSYSSTVQERSSTESAATPATTAPAAQAPTPAAPAASGLVKGGTYTLKVKKKGYYTAAEALAGSVKPGNPSGVRNPGTYYIFNISQGMLNLTTVKNVPGSWVNPN